jgi:hypothetical protein
LWAIKPKGLNRIDKIGYFCRNRPHVLKCCWSFKFPLLCCWFCLPSFCVLYLMLSESVDWSLFIAPSVFSNSNVYLMVLSKRNHLRVKLYKLINNMTFVNCRLPVKNASDIDTCWLLIYFTICFSFYQLSCWNLDVIKLKNISNPISIQVFSYVEKTTINMKVSGFCNEMFFRLHSPKKMG